ncbi:hypothetical protein GV828_10665 [Flavobacterium sp. NST-5]|uniref:YcxB-like protein domain-containing protein n=1 Tax=Flavobacterium ichthyis TaxID=2698827 RepID=A0ABW9ZAT8_9FLAO|nr:hypothetical protein [Flavobacterium ichthyis]NBL65662.1 hypothetical protein [Flavobacterium ichthyis]
MIVEYKIQENDFLQMNLFLDKVSGELKQSLKYIVIWMIGNMLFLCLLLYLVESYEAFYVIAGFSIIQIISYIASYKGIRLRQMQKAVRKRYMHDFNQLVFLEIEDQYFKIKMEQIETKFDIAQLETVYETKFHIFIKLKSSNLVIPKPQLRNWREVANRLELLTIANKKGYFKQLNWRL